MRKKTIIKELIFLSVLLLSNVYASTNFTWRVLRKEKIPETGFHTGQLAAWSQETISTFNGWQYVSYYNADEKHCVGRRKLPDGAWETFSFSDYTLSTTDRLKGEMPSRTAGLSRGRERGRPRTHLPDRSR